MFRLGLTSSPRSGPRCAHTRVSSWSAPDISRWVISRRHAPFTRYHCTVIVPTIDGWIPQWYANVPRVDIVTGSAAPPATMIGVVKLFVSWMMSWLRVSTFFQMTRCPTVTVVGLGTNELLPLMPVMLTVTSAAGVGVGVGVDGLESPQPTMEAATATSIAMCAIRMFMAPVNATAVPTKLQGYMMEMSVKGTNRSRAAYFQGKSGRLDVTDPDRFARSGNREVRG